MAAFPHHSGGVLQVSSPGRWGAVPEALIEDSRLSLDTRAVAAWLAIKAHGWQISVKYLRQQMELGEERWLRIAREMEEAGYFSRLKQQGEGGQWEWRITFSPVSTIPGLPGHGLPVPGSSVPGQPVDINNTKVNNTNLTNTTTTGGGCRFEDLPETLQERARAIVQGLPEALKNDVVDELLGQIRARVVKKPERLLQTLVAAAHAGALTLDYARQERKRRSAHAIVEEAKGRELPLDSEAKEKGAAFYQKYAPSLLAKIDPSIA